MKEKTPETADAASRRSRVHARLSAARENPNCIDAQQLLLGLQALGELRRVRIEPSLVHLRGGV